MDSIEAEFKTAVDTWYYWLIAAIALLVAVLVYPLAAGTGLQGIMLLVLSELLAVSVLLWIMLTTRYTITRDRLIGGIL